MRYKVFLDTNILLSGIFFNGNESKILDLVEIDFITSEDVVEELYKIVKKKLKYLKERSLEIALTETKRALADIVVVQRPKYVKKVQEAANLISHKKDVPILAAALPVKPDYFLTGDSHFFTDKVRDAVTVITAKEFLHKIRKK
ncbi:MAG: putative toxin-antitoxin system toxin component, PIN family [Nitrospirae bacterium]|nr:putative toxin-antitoxin system toxin component, PIN family [Nitrospirota bacterium]